MARNSDFASYCNNLLNDPNDLMNFDSLSHDSPVEPLVYYDLQPVSEPIKESSGSLCNMQSSNRMSCSSTADLNMNMSSEEHINLKKKESTQGSDFEDDINEDFKSIRNDDSKKHNHSEIEKRRRDKMNSYITELASMIPMCHTMSRKLDKLSVLRMAVQHMKTIQGTVNSYTEGNYKPSFLSNQDLKNLITHAAEVFVFAVSCDHGKILYISKSVTQVLNYLPEDLVGNNVFDYIHPKDVAKVKEQLSCSDFWPRDRYINAKTMLPVRAEIMSKISSGARRSFFCRMKCKVQLGVKEEADTTTGSKYTPSDSSSVGSKSSILSSDVHCSSQKSRDKRYTVIQCTGYLKPWTHLNECDNLSGKSMELGDDIDGNCVGGDTESVNSSSCLVAVGRIINNSASTSLLSDIVKPPCFTSKHTIDGKFLSVDQRVTYVTGFLPQELLGSSMYEYFHQDDISRLVDVHKATLQDNKPKDTEIYKFRTKDKAYVHLRSEWKSFRNPWTKDIEFIVANNILTKSDSKPDSSNKSECSSQGQSQNYDVFKEQQLGNKEIQNLINSYLEASKIGKNIADTALVENKKTCDVKSSQSLTHHDVKIEASIDDDDFRFPKSLLLQAAYNNNNDNPCTSFGGEVAGGGGGVDAVTCTSYSAIQGDVNPSSSASTVGTTDSDHALSLLCPHSALMIPGGDSADDMMLGDMMTPSSPRLMSGSESSDEAAMAVIMSLLEADAGLGGPVDLSGLPWPLP